MWPLECCDDVAVEASRVKEGFALVIAGQRTPGLHRVAGGSWELAPEMCKSNIAGSCRAAQLRTKITSLLSPAACCCCPAGLSQVPAHLPAVRPVVAAAETDLIIKTSIRKPKGRGPARPQQHTIIEE
jgi:hypothetical protein